MIASLARFESKPADVQDGRDATSFFEGTIVVLVVLVAPVLLYVAHQAAYGRLLYPLANFALAGYLFVRRSPWYAGHCLLVFCFVSLVRRLVDEQAGWDASNPVLLTPYLCCFFASISLLDYWLKPQPRSIGPFLVILSCVAYGAALAMLHCRLFASLVDALKWSVGPLFAVYVLAHRNQLASMRAVVESCLVWAGAAMGAYGVLQYVSPPSWDAEWMRNVSQQLGLTSIGQPEPFSLRVFSTMNSPGSFGAMLSAGIIIGLKRTAPVTALTVTLMVIGLALCQYRSIWAATMLAAIMIVAAGKTTMRPANIFALILTGVALCSTAVVPRIREAVVLRAATLTQLKGDASLDERLSQYGVFAHGDENLVVGSGLGINGASRRLDKNSIVVIDSGLIEIWRSMGIVVGTTFLLAIAAVVSKLFSTSSPPSSDHYFDRAIAVATFVQLPMGSVHIGEMGFCAWLFLSFGLAALLNLCNATGGNQMRKLHG